MANGPELTWGRSPNDLPARWPRKADGTPEAPALLTHRMEWNYESEILEQKLRAYDIPVFRQMGNLGTLSKIVLGFSGSGVDLYVPESLLSDAQELLRPVEEDEQTPNESE